MIAVESPIPWHFSTMVFLVGALTVTFINSTHDCAGISTPCAPAAMDNSSLTATPVKSAREKAQEDFEWNFSNGKLGTEDSIKVVVDNEAGYATYFITINAQEVKPLGEAEFFLKVPKGGSFKWISMKGMNTIFSEHPKNGKSRIHTYATIPGQKNLRLYLKAIAPLPQTNSIKPAAIGLPEIEPVNFKSVKPQVEYLPPQDVMYASNCN